MDVRIVKAAAAGTVRAIPSKSMAHRWLIAAALSGIDIGDKAKMLSQDIDATRNCLAGLLACASGDTAERAILRPGESGSTLRFLLPVAGALGVDADFECQGRLAERPLKILRDMLTEHGCSMSAEGSNPVQISGKLEPGEYRLPGNVSSQYVTGLLMALPMLDGDSIVRVEGRLQSRPYIDMTLAVLEASGIYIEETQSAGCTEFAVRGGQKYALADFPEIEGDWSNAALWVVLNELVGGGVECTGLKPDSVQGDMAIESIVRLADESALAELCGTATEVVIDAGDIPDLVPAICVWATSLSEGSTVRLTSIERLRFKESDRVEAVVSMLRSLGGIIESDERTITVRGTVHLQGGEIDSFNDHRIVMAAAVAAALCEGEVLIHGAEAVRKSYPGFFEDYEMLGGKIEYLENDGQE